MYISAEAADETKPFANDLVMAYFTWSKVLGHRMFHVWSAIVANLSLIALLCSGLFANKVCAMTPPQLPSDPVHTNASRSYRRSVSVMSKLQSKLTQ